MCLARVYVNKESALSYQMIFTRLFEEISVMCGRPFKWRHIHKEGVAAVIVDMSRAQAAGKLWLCLVITGYY